MSNPITTAADMREAAKRVIQTHMTDERKAQWTDGLGSIFDTVSAIGITLKQLAADVGALPIADQQTKPGEADVLLTELSKHQNWSLEYIAKTYCDDDEPAINHWAVHKERGPVNDREWDEIGSGQTPREALSGALATIGTLPIAELWTVDATKPPWPPAANFYFGQIVEKPRGAHWSGHICGWYSTPTTRIGYNVLSDRHENSVQIYPETALVPIGEKA